jgi:hypothetical protein
MIIEPNKYTKNKLLMTYQQIFQRAHIIDFYSHIDELTDTTKKPIDSCGGKIRRFSIVIV